ncbi:MAG: YIP1 family protein [Roseinatronobacter sp.]
MSLFRNIVQTYRAPRDTVRLLAAPDLREPQVLFFGSVACGLIFVSQWPVLSRAAALDPSITFEQRMGGALFGVMFVLPLLLYAIAWILQILLRLAGRPIEGLHVRLALFWSLLCTAPLMLVQGGLSGVMGKNLFVLLFGFVVAGVFLYILGAGLSALIPRGRAQTR